MKTPRAAPSGGSGGGTPRRAAPGRNSPSLASSLDLSVRIGPIKLANPVLTASGTFGYGDEYAHVLAPDALGAVITKTVTMKPRVGNPPERTAETAAGMLNSIGLENVGLKRFRSEKLPRLSSLECTV